MSSSGGDTGAATAAATAAVCPTTTTTHCDATTAVSALILIELSIPHRHRRQPTKPSFSGFYTLYFYTFQPYTVMINSFIASCVFISLRTGLVVLYIFFLFCTLNSFRLFVIQFSELHATFLIIFLIPKTHRFL